LEILKGTKRWTQKRRNSRLVRGYCQLVIILHHIGRSHTFHLLIASEGLLLIIDDLGYVVYLLVVTSDCPTTPPREVLCRLNRLIAAVKVERVTLKDLAHIESEILGS